jgi:hypothetical protein
MENLPIPGYVHTAPDSFGFDAFDARIGTDVQGARNAGLSADPAVAAANTFVQLEPRSGQHVGVYMTTANRLTSAPIRVSPVLKLATSAPAQGEADARIFPFRLRNGTPQLATLTTSTAPATLAPSAGGIVGGGAWIELMDTRSGGRFRIDVATYGSTLAATGAPRDAVTGVPVLHVVAGLDTSYGVATGSFIGDTSSYWFRSNGSYFTFTMGDVNMRNAIAAAQSLDPGLSGDPADYIVAAIAEYNEVVGDGELALRLYGPRLLLAPR